MLKDFNIEDEAGGTGKPIVKKFTAVVTRHTLKIHLYWAGRGTTGIPARGMYGPLISTISIIPSKLLQTLQSLLSFFSSLVKAVVKYSGAFQLSTVLLLKGLIILTELPVNC